MNLFLKISLILGLAILTPSKLFACAVCYGGDIDSPMADGMNWGIFTLFGVIAAVLGSFLIFFVHIIRKSEALTTAAEKIQNPTNV